MTYLRRASGLWCPDYHLRFPPERGFAQPNYSILPGHFPAGAVARAKGGVFTTLSLRTSATSTAATITVPASVVAGDILVLADRSRNNSNGSAPTKVVPSDFTEVADNLRNETRLITSYKLADGSEAGNSLAGMNENVNTKALYVFSGDAAIASLALKSVASEDTNGTPATQTVTSGSGAAPLVVMGAYGTFNGAIDPRGFSPAKDGEISPAQELYLAYKIYNSSPANVDVSMGDEGFRNMLHSWYLEAA